MMIVYVSHPYGGVPGNRVRCNALIRKLSEKYPEILFISALHAVRRPYESVDYATGLKLALELESRCDAVYMATGWEESVGCQVEVQFARKYGLEIVGEGYELTDELEAEDRYISPESFYADLDKYIKTAEKVIAAAWKKRKKKK